MCLVWQLAFFLALPLVPAQAAESPIDEIGSVWSNSKVGAAVDPAPFAEASNILRAFAQIPAPKLQSRDVAEPAIPLVACDRDYSALCPDGFVRIGAVKDDSEEYCAGASDYTGPCDGAYAFGGMSLSAKSRWSDMCLSFWPCKRCMRDVQTPCPQGWHQESQGGVCRPSPEYEGPCDAPVDFGSYNAAMRDRWSSQCGAYWACDVNDGSSPGQAIASPTHVEMQPVAFLAAKTIPVDGYKIRNSLYLTQPMREPAQASVNVIMREDMPGMQEQSKYKGMEDQLKQLQEHIKDVVRAMSK